MRKWGKNSTQWCICVINRQAFACISYDKQLGLRRSRCCLMIEFCFSVIHLCRWSHGQRQLESVKNAPLWPATPCRDVTPYCEKAGTCRARAIHTSELFPCKCHAPRLTQLFKPAKQQDVNSGHQRSSCVWVTRRVVRVCEFLSASRTKRFCFLV